MARSAARAAAMQLVYENLMGGSGEDTLGALIAFTPEGDDQAYIDATVAGIESHAEELDALIARYSTSRELARIARVDLCILRLALYEMRYAEDVPTSAAINEAVELAKKYDSKEASAYINGILGAADRDGWEERKEA